MNEPIVKTAVDPDLPDPERAVPWGMREVWGGLAFVGVWILLQFGGTALISTFNWTVNIGPVMILAELMLVIPVGWLVLVRYPGKWKELGVRGFHWEALVLGFGLLIMLYGFNCSYSFLLYILKLQPSIDWVEVFSKLGSPWWLFITGALIAPLVEEFLFRGLIFPGLRQRYGWVRAMLVSAALFSFTHLQLTSAIPIFLMGCLLAYLVQFSKSIWPAVIIHIATNTISLGLAYLVAVYALPH